MTAILEATGLRKAFGGLVAVDGIDVALRAGEILGLVGPNGSGKSTTLNLIAGAIPLDRGEIRVNGRDVSRLPAHLRVRQRINRTFQLVRVLPGLSVRENVMIGALYGATGAGIGEARRTTDRLLAWFDLTAKADLAGSQLTYIDQKRLELARTCATGPAVLLLDEWLSGLNPTELQEGIGIVRRIADEGVAIIMVEHVMSAIRALCPRLIVMSSGREIAAGATDTVLRDPQVQEAYLGREDAEG